MAQSSYSGGVDQLAALYWKRPASGSAAASRSTAGAAGQGR